MRRGHHPILLLVTGYLAAACPGTGFAQSEVIPVSYTTLSSVYTQTFDGLPATGSFTLTGKGPLNLTASPVNAGNLQGWQVWMHGGSNTNAGFATSTGSSTGSNSYSLGSIGSTERALGTLASGSGVYAVGLILTNNTGVPLNQCTVSFTCEQWRKGGSGNKNTWSFQYKTGSFTRIDQTGTSDTTALDMGSVIHTTSAATLNGNLPENRRIVSFTLQNIHWKNGEQLLLRWDDADETGSDDACGIDNFSFSANQVITLPTANNLAATGISSLSATLNGSIHDGFANTTAVFEYDTAALFTNPIRVNVFPDTIYTGSGNTHVSAQLSGLLTGITYYYRVKAKNSSGTTESNPLSFTTAFSLPVIVTKIPADISLTSASLGGSISSTGGTFITERGIVWALSNTPSIADHKIIITGDTTQFSQPINNLPQGSIVYTRAYAINQVGIAYGNTFSFTTATNIVSFTPATALLTNASSVNFIMKTAQPATGVSVANFSLVTNSITGATVTSITGSGSSFTIAVQTGSGDGALSIQLNNDAGVSIPLFNKPFAASASYVIDKSPPVITNVSVPNKPMKYGDTVPVFISVKADTDNYRPVTVKINGITANGFQKQSDSVYQCHIIISNGTQDMAAGSAISTSIVLKDSIGNSNIPYQLPIVQPSDLIDATRPVLSSVILPADGLYKAGDTLDFIFRFSETIVLTNTAGNATVSVTVGSRSKPSLYISGDGSDSLLYRYIVQPGESDKDGIRFSSPLTFYNTIITDPAGNTATLSYSFPTSKKILVDGVIPVISSVTTPVAAIYRPGNILDLLVNYSKKIWLDTIDAAPSVPVIIGSTTRNAVYTSGSGGSSLLFRYTVQDNDMDKDGIKLGPAIELNNASLHDEAGNLAFTELNNIGALSKIIVNPPTVLIAGVTVPPDSLYKPGDILAFVVRYNEKVMVNTSAGIPSIRFTTGSTSKQALFTAGSGGTDLLFSYTIQAGDLDTNGITLNTTLALNNGSIKDDRGNDVPVTITNTGSTTGMLIDGVVPVIKAVGTPAKNTYRKNDTLYFVVSFSEKVLIPDLKDSLFLNLQIGDIIRKAMYRGGSGTSALVFSYAIQAGDIDRNGIKLDSLIFPHGNMITDAAGNTASPILKNIGALSGIRIDAVPPYFISNHSQLELCSNSSVSIHDLLQIKQEDDDTLSWQVITIPAHGFIPDSLMAGVLVNNNPFPKIVYKPAENYSGWDSLTIQVTDGAYTIRKTIYLLVQSLITNNRIGTTQTICSGNQPQVISGTLPSGGNGSYKFVWETAGINDPVSFTTATGIISSQQYTPGKLTASTWFRRKVISSACTDISPATSISVMKTGYWTGGFDTEWNNPNNWCGNTIPGNTTDVIIDGNALYDPVIKDQAYCHNIHLQNHALISVNGYLYTSGNIILSAGNVDAIKGTIVFNGNIPQVTGPAVWLNSSIKNIIIHNPSGVTVTEPISITGTLLLQAGSLITNDHLRLIAAANIGPSAENTLIKGNILIEHFIPGGRSAFRIMGHPFTTPVALDMIKDSIDITGEGGSVNGFVTTVSNRPSAFLHDYQNSNDSTGIDAGWRAFSNTHQQQGNFWEPYKGIGLWVRGKPGQGLDGTPAGNGNNGTYFPAPVTLLFSGPVNTGEQEIILPIHTRPTYHIVSNPYASPIDLSLVTHGTGIAPNYWLWDPWQGNKGGYSSRRFRDTNILPAFGAFIVRTNDTVNNQLLFTENCKTANTQNTPADPYITLRLETDSIFWDEVTIYPTDSARIYFDKQDAEKFNNEAINFYSISRDKKRLSTDARPVNNESVIPLGLQTNQQKSFRIKVPGIHMPANNSLLLHDRYLSKWMKLEKDSSYSFAVTGDTLSKGDQRFEISAFKKQLMDTATVYKLITQIHPVPAHDKLMISYTAPIQANTSIRILSQNGTVMKQVALGLQKTGQFTIHISDLSPGIYLLEVRSGDYTTTQKIIKQ